MSSCSLLLVLLVLTCLQFFTTAQSNGPKQCCFSHQRDKIPVRLITQYEKTDRQCTRPGVIFTLQNGRHLCADSTVEWVQKHMKTVDQRKPSS
ncbi:C-C motif chemokine 3-like [Clarias gariepinus]|uniref:C-C motif chemokine 3-like n=1 Tax=Clarias gariepinus TaxID=13013 RepID=UPI00234CFBBD|nr:C-C motif chemokine 3-like [Clarias gariepinus]